MNSLLLCIPFAGLLLCIAVMPLVKPEWWEKHQVLAVIVWSLLFYYPVYRVKRRRRDDRNSVRVYRE